VLGLNTLGLVLAPSLLGGWELLLVALRPTPTVLVLVGGRLDAWIALIIAVPTRLLLDLAYFLAARHGGLAVLGRFRWGALVVRPMAHHRSVRALQRIALVYASTPVDIALGLGPTSLPRFLAVTGVGTTVSTVFYLLVASSVAGPAGGVLDWVARHATVVTLVIVVAVVAAVAVGVRRRSRTRSS